MDRYRPSMSPLEWPETEGYTDLNLQWNRPPITVGKHHRCSKIPIKAFKLVRLSLEFCLYSKPLSVMNNHFSLFTTSLLEDS